MRSLASAIVENRRKQDRYKRIERLLRRMRQRVFDYEDAGKGEQASRIIAKCKAILKPLWEARAEALEHARGQRILNTWA